LIEHLLNDALWIANASLPAAAARIRCARWLGTSCRGAARSSLPKKGGIARGGRVVQLAETLGAGARGGSHH
jgi:hypothetical protein